MKKVWVNGSFDIIHVGHIRLLQYANHFGSVRVGLDTDERIKEKKGNDRPINNIHDRIEMISSIKFVNEVVFFNSDDELIDEIKKYKPDIFVIGDDYKNKKIIGSEYVKEIIYFNRIFDYSTTDLINKCKKNVGKTTSY